MTEEAGARSRRSSRRWWIAAIVALVVVCILVVQGANRPADPYFVDASPGTPATREFQSIGFRITGPGAEAVAAAERCALLAETDAEKAQGLMNRTNLDGWDGMLFRFATDVTSGFYMKDTPLPLSIAWFDADGEFVSATDMDPCLRQPSCPTYTAEGPYRYALEVPRGRLPELGAVAGSRLVVGGGCG